MIERIEALAKEASESDADDKLIAVCLKVILGAYKAGDIALFARECVKFAREAIG